MSDETSHPMVLCDDERGDDDGEPAPVAESVDDLRDWHCRQKDSEEQQQRGGSVAARERSPASPRCWRSDSIRSLDSIEWMSLIRLSVTLRMHLHSSPDRLATAARSNRQQLTPGSGQSDVSAV